MFVKISRKKKLIMLILIMSVVAYFRWPGDPPDVSTLGLQQPGLAVGNTLPPLINSTTMLSIIPADLPVQWQRQNTLKKDGMVTLIMDRSGNHRVTVTIIDKKTPEIARYALTPENFSYPQSSVDWGQPSETIYHNEKAMKGTYIRDGVVMGELISYPHDRYLVTAYILGENDKTVDMMDILDRLEFPE